MIQLGAAFIVCESDGIRGHPRRDACTSRWVPVDKEKEKKRKEKRKEKKRKKTRRGRCERRCKGGARGGVSGGARRPREGRRKGVCNEAV